MGVIEKPAGGVMVLSESDADPAGQIPPGEVTMSNADYDTKEGSQPSSESSQTIYRGAIGGGNTDALNSVKSSIRACSDRDYEDHRVQELKEVIFERDMELDKERSEVKRLREKCGEIPWAESDVSANFVSRDMPPVADRNEKSFQSRDDFGSQWTAYVTPDGRHFHLPSECAEWVVQCQMSEVIKQYEVRIAQALSDISEKTRVIINLHSCLDEAQTRTSQLHTDVAKANRRANSAEAALKIIRDAIDEQRGS